MTVWAPDGGREEMSFGPERPAPDRSPRLLLAAALAGALVVGGFLGVRLAEWRAAQADGASRGVLLAGDIERRPYGGEHGPVFGVPLHNGSSETVEVTDIGFDGLRSRVVPDGHLSIPPGVWATVRFGAPANCFVEAPLSLDELRVTLRTASGQRDERVPLPGAGQAVLDYHEAICARQVMPEVSDLLGVWVLEDAFGAQNYVGTLVWRFDDDGRFVADPEGLALLDVQHGVEGHYSLGDGEMRLDVDGGYGCRGGIHSHWRPSIVAGPEAEAPEIGMGLVAVWLRGECPDDMEGQVWVFRRVLRGVDPDGAVRRPHVSTAE